MSQSPNNNVTLDTTKVDITSNTKAFQQTQAMFFPVTPFTPEVLMMDEQDYREHWLLNALEDDNKPPTVGVDCVDSATAAAYDRINLSPTPTEESTLIDEDDHMEELIASSSLHTKDGDDANDSTSSITAAVAASSLIKSEPQTESQAIEAIVQCSSDAKPAATNDSTIAASDNEKDHEGTGIPTKFDVLCGQSRICASHSGNKRFQVVLGMYATRYENATSKQEKMTLTKEIVACITNSGGRFLKYKDGMWQEISTVLARDKVSHALRTKNASWKKQQKEEQAGAKKTGKPKRAMSVVAAAATKSKKTHRRRRSAPVASKRRPSSSASIKTCFSEGAASFDANDSSSNIMDTLLSKQREIFASLTQKPTDSDANEVHPLKK